MDGPRQFDKIYGPTSFLGSSGNRCERHIFPGDEAKASTASRPENRKSKNADRPQTHVGPMACLVFLPRGTQYCCSRSSGCCCCGSRRPSCWSCCSNCRHATHATNRRVGPGRPSSGHGPLDLLGLWNGSPTQGVALGFRVLRLRRTNIHLHRGHTISVTNRRGPKGPNPKAQGNALGTDRDEPPRPQRGQTRKPKATP